ncbi:MAG TPA: ABC transporter permease [Acidimicrobiia bacterium]|nr:ABC transporter permease [Acidimicrobiia bacterium]
MIALLVGVSGGATLAPLAAARRTDTAFARMRDATDAWDVLINPNNGSVSRLTMAKLRRLPGIERIGRVDGILLYPSIVHSVSDVSNLPPVLVSDGHAGYTIGRPVLLRGHQPARGDASGVFVDRTFAQQSRLHVGQAFHFVVMTPRLFQQLQTATSASAAKALLNGAPRSLQGTAHIEGIGMTQDGVVVDPGYTPAAFTFSPAFRVAHPDVQSPYWGAAVRLKPGVDVDAFTARVRALVPDESIAFQRASAVSAEVENATDPEVMALEAFAALAALLGLVVVAQALSRRMQFDAQDNATLAAIGTTRHQRMTVALAKAALAVAAGTVLAVVIAVAASPLGPVGQVRVAEVHPGVAFDWPVLLLGALAILTLGVGFATLPAWRASRVTVTEPRASRSRIVAVVTAAGGSLASAVGVQFALEPGTGRSRVPVRTTLTAAASAVALVTSVVVFSASIDHLLATPRLYGSAWDAQIALDTLNSPAGFDATSESALDRLERQFVEVADRSGSIADSALLQVGEVRSGVVAIPALGYSSSLRGVAPTIANGRAPATTGEIALGATTMARLHTHVGGTIALAAREEGPNRVVRIVGETVLPGLAPYSGSDKAGLGVGALLTRAGWQRFSSDFQKTEYIFRWMPHASVATLSRTFARKMPAELPVPVDPINRPAGVVSVQQLRSTPALLALLVAVLLAAAVANALVITVRRRRREFAVLRTLGLTRAQILRTVLWQATTVALVAVVFGIPAGIVIGHWTWRVLADRLGTLAVPTLPGVALLGVAAAVLLLANLVAFVPGLRAARAPARVLRTE